MNSLRDEIKVTLVATGLNAVNKRGAQKAATPFPISGTDTGASRGPVFTPPASADNGSDIFARRTPASGIDNINVPSFLKR